MSLSLGQVHIMANILPVSLFHEVQSHLPLDTLKSFLDYHNQCNNFHPYMLLKIFNRTQIDKSTVQSLSSLFGVSHTVILTILIHRLAYDCCVVSILQNISTWLELELNAWRCDTTVRILHSYTLCVLYSLTYMYFTLYCSLYCTWSTATLSLRKLSVAVDV